MHKSVKYLLILSAAAILFWFAATFLFGGAMPVVPLAFFCLTAGLLWAARRLPLRGWTGIGLFFLAGLFIPSARMIQVLDTPPEPVNNLVNTLLFWILVLALLIAAVLLYSALNERQAGRAPVRFALVLSAVLLLKILHNLYWLTVWDNTYDALTYIWLIMPALAAAICALALVLLLPGRRKLAGLIFLLLPVGMAVVSAAAQQVDNQRLTEARAAQVARAIESYQAREGRYPVSLRLLVPRDALVLPGPLLLYGQDWCYAASPAGYRLGYLGRTHWSAPKLVVHAVQSGGDIQELPPACAAESAALLKNLPDYWEVSEVSP